MSIVDELLKSIPEEIILEESSQLWVGKLLESVNNAIVELNIDQECLSMTSSGKALREAINSLPAKYQVSILNDCVISYGQRKRRELDKIVREEHEQNMKDRNLKREIIRFGAIMIISLCSLFIGAIIFISWKQNTTPDAEIANSLLNTVIQILKLIFALN